MAECAYKTITILSVTPELLAYNRGVESRIYLCLVVISGVIQQDVIAGVLEMLICDLESETDICLKMMKVIDGHVCLLRLLNDGSSVGVMTLITNILAFMVNSSHATALIDDLLCADVFTVILNLLDFHDDCVVENISVLILKCSFDARFKRLGPILGTLVDREYRSEFVCANMQTVADNLNVV